MSKVIELSPTERVDWTISIFDVNTGLLIGKYKKPDYSIQVGDIIQILDSAGFVKIYDIPRPYLSPLPNNNDYSIFVKERV